MYDAFDDDRSDLDAYLAIAKEVAAARVVTFGSDARDPESVARGFREAMQMADAFGFRPGPMRHELWGRMG